MTKRTYRGKYPTRINAIWINKGIAHLQTNKGDVYTLDGRATGGNLPNLGDDIFSPATVGAEFAVLRV